MRKATWLQLIIWIALGSFVAYLLFLHFGIIQGDNKICEKAACSNNEDYTVLDPSLAALWQIGEFLNHWSPAIAALAAVAVAGFTLTLKWSTDKLWSEAQAQRQSARKGGLASVISARAALRSSRAAEKSANTAEMALVALEAPIILPFDMNFVHNGPLNFVSFCFRNFGRSPANISSVSIKVHITKANVPNEILIYKDRVFMIEEIIAEKEVSETLTFRDDMFRQYGPNISNAIADLHVYVHYTWENTLRVLKTEGRSYIWSPRRRKFLAGAQLWDDPERFGPKNIMPAGVLRNDKSENANP